MCSWARCAGHNAELTDDVGTDIKMSGGIGGDVLSHIQDRGGLCGDEDEEGWDHAPPLMARSVAVCRD